LLESIGFWNVEMLKRKIEELETLKGGTLNLTKGLTNIISIKEVSYNLKVERSILITLKKIGLITLKKTLKL
jgi:predicted nuclease of restriction endonuclease-like RecB superfamily